MTGSLTLTSAMLKAAYELLLTTPPFRGWKMPSSSKVKFKVNRSKDDYGLCLTDTHPTEYTIYISDSLIGHMSSLIGVMAHEMVHVHLYERGMATSQHGPAFQRCAASVARYHGFDPKSPRF